MNKRLLLPALLIISISLISCQNFSAREGKQQLQIPVETHDSLETRFSATQEERQKQEALALEQSEELKRQQELERAQKQEEAYKQALGEIASLQQEKLELKELVAQLETQLTDQTQKTTDIEQTLSEQILLLATELSESTEDVLSLETKAAIRERESQEREAALNQQLDEVRADLKYYQQALNLTSMTLDERQTALVEHINALEAQLRTTQKELSTEQNALLAHIEQLQDDLSTAQQLKTETETALIEQSVLLQQEKDAVSVLRSELQTTEEERNSLQLAFDTAQEKISALQQELENVTSKYLHIERLTKQQETLLSEARYALLSTEEERNSLQLAFDTAQAKISALQQELDNEKSVFMQRTQEIERLAKQQESLLSATEAEAYHRYKELEKTYKQISDAYRELEASYEQLFADSQTLQQTLSEQTLELEALQASSILLEQENQQLQDTLQEKLSLEQQREKEALLQQEERRLAQLALQQQLDLAREQEMKRQAALEAEWKQIPPIEELTLPRKYRTEAPISLAKDTDQLNVMLLPLSDKKWEQESMANTVHQSIQDLAFPVIFVTGHMENVIALIKEMRLNATLVEGGAIVTSFPVIEEDIHGVRIQFSEQKTLRLSLANLVEHAVFEAFLANEDWQKVQQEIHPQRQEILANILQKGSLTEPTLIGSSFYEPSFQDWSIFSPVSYRQIDYLWPLSAFMEDAQFFDVYRMTHFSYATNAGNTYFTKQLQERFDYIYSRKLLPLSSSMLTIGGESAAKDQGSSRYGVVARFLVP
jgi:hypothetical protein